MQTEVTRGIDHIGITVPDIEAATAFLLEAFDARVLYDTHPRTAEPQLGVGVERRLHLASGAEIVAIRMIRLHHGPGLELFEMRSAEQARPAVPSDLGLQHFALYVDDAASAIDRFRAAGGTMFSDPHPLPPLESGAGNVFCYGQAPWGTIIEFLSYPTPQPYRETTALRRWTPKA